MFLKNQLYALKVYESDFVFYPDIYVVESVKNSAISKLLKANKSRCFKVVGCSTRSTWFHKRQHRRLNRSFFVGNSVSGQLNLYRCEFWQLTSQLLARDVCLLDAFA
ncbi:DUF645 family protein [Vibrio mimicus]|nr:DUF645 family protein [Vibrio mimicus]